MSVAICLGLGAAMPCVAQPTYIVFPAVPSASQLGTRPTPRQTAAVTLTARDSTIAYVVRAITHQAGFRLSYETNNPLFARRISVRVAKVPVMDALRTALKGTGLTAWVAPDGETIVIRPQQISSGHGRVDVADGVVMGRVTDSASGKGIGGATVLVKGTALRTTTSDNGQFTLKAVPAGEQTLTVRAFGYKPQTLSVTVTDSEHTVVTVALVPTPTVLSGVVTQVSGVQERKKVGTDIVVLNADSIMRVAPVSTVTDLIETRVPGATVLRESGIPGAPRRVRLRGTSSIERSNDPILIVDGVRVNADQSGAQSTIGNSGSTFYGPSPLDQIDPNSIETLEVFRGPSASAMYGADAGNGVIVITTKHGRAGHTHWNLALDNGRTSLSSGGYPLNTFRFGHLDPGSISAGFFSQGVSHLCFVTKVDCANLDSIVRYQALNDPRFNVFSHGLKRDASLSVSGGTGSLTYALTGSASSESGLFQLPAIEIARFQAVHGFAPPSWMRHPDQYTTWGGTSRLDLPLNPNGATVALTNSYFQSQQQQSSLQSAVGQLLGRYVDTTQFARVPLLGNDIYQRALVGTGTMTTAATLHWPVRSWLPLDATAGLNLGTNDNRSVEPAGYSPNTDAAGNILLDTLGSYALGQGQTVQQTLNGSTTLLVPGRAGLQELRLPIGFNWMAQSAHFLSATGSVPMGVLDPTVLASGFTNSGGSAPTQNRQTTTTYGWYLVPTLDFGHGVYWSPGFRFDGGSASGQNGGLVPFPKLDLSWLAIDQPDQPVLGAITLLRPRIAFGVAGVQPDPMSQYRLLTQQTVVYPDGSTQQIALVGTYGNTKLVPERSRELEGGFDTELWNQRLIVKLTGYHKLRYHAIVTSPIAPSAGAAAGFSVIPGVSTLGTGQVNGGTVASYAYNVGTVRNVGVDADVEARVLDSRRALWKVTALISKRTNALLSLGPGVRDSTGTTLFKPGYPLNGIWARPIAGYVDANQNGRIDPGEVRLGNSSVFLGAPEPNYQLTLSTTLSLFNSRLSVSTAADYQNGLTQTYNVATSQFGCPGGFNAGGCVAASQYNAFNSALNDPLTPLSQQAAIVASCSISPSNACSGIGLTQTVNTLRWQSLSVNYTVPNSLTHLLRLGTMAVALQGSNLALHTNYRGKDPNVGATPGSNSILDQGQLPQPTLWQLRVTLGN